jgi:chorismate synthase
MSTLRFLSAGESHGPGETGILEGMPAGLSIDISFIQNELNRRRKGNGRGAREHIEDDAVTILSGIHYGKTIGSPITVQIQNKDFENWKSRTQKETSVTAARPGHADLAGAIKYGFTDSRPVLERASARETTIRTAIGAICKLFLKEFKIEITSRIISVGNENLGVTIENAIKNKDTLGGIIEIQSLQVPAGLGSYIQWDSRLDGRISQALMSIPSVKAVEIGYGIENAQKFGSLVHDEIFYENGRICRKTNHAGGIEGGISNGEPIIVRIYLKPIPTLGNPLHSFDMKTKINTQAVYERSDICVVDRAGVIGESMAAFILCQVFLEKFGGDHMTETKRNYEGFIQNILK